MNTLKNTSKTKAVPSLSDKETPVNHPLFGQSVFVLQGGGALGAYQAGIYEAMHTAGIEPDWVVGTSIGAINGAIIAGNHPKNRLERLRSFWDKMTIDPFEPLATWAKNFGNGLINVGTVTRGVPGFFSPNPLAACGSYAQLGIEQASYYSTQPLKTTLENLVDIDFLNSHHTRFSVGAVNANSGQMRYFDNKKEPLGVEHVMASGALPPAFPAVRIDGEPYWDGGIYSNTPIELVLDDNPRLNSTIIAVQLWTPKHDEPKSMQQINERLKDIQFSTRDTSHVERQRQIHKLRHIIRDMSNLLPQALREQPDIRRYAAWGCSTLMHIIRLHAPRLQNEDASKDIDFTAEGIKARWQAGVADGRRMIESAPWNQKPTDTSDGVLIHEVS
jgi:NTE family protein